MAKYKLKLCGNILCGSTGVQWIVVDMDDSDDVSAIRHVERIMGNYYPVYYRGYLFKENDSHEFNLSIADFKAKVAVFTDVYAKPVVS